MAFLIVTGQNYDQPVIAPPHTRTTPTTLNSIGTPPLSPSPQSYFPTAPLSQSYLVPNVITLATVGGRDAISATNDPHRRLAFAPRGTSPMPNGHSGCLSTDSCARYDIYVIFLVNQLDWFSNFSTLLLT